MVKNRLGLYSMAYILNIFHLASHEILIWRAGRGGCKSATQGLLGSWVGAYLGTWDGYKAEHFMRDTYLGR